MGSGSTGKAAVLEGFSFIGIEREAEYLEIAQARNVICLPPLGEYLDNLGRPASEYIFSGEQGKRDSIVVVAQLSPEFTARLVDRWQELANRI